MSQTIIDTVMQLCDEHGVEYSLESVGNNKEDFQLEIHADHDAQMEALGQELANLNCTIVGAGDEQYIYS